MRKYLGAKARKAIFTDVRELFRRGVDHHKRGQFKEAIAAYDHIIKLKSDHADAHLNRGAALNSLGRHAEALTSYDRAIALRPDYARAHLNRGNALCNLDRYDEAIAACDHAITLEPGNAEFHSRRGYMLRAAGRSMEALASYDRAIALKPDYAEVHYNRGNALHDLGRLDDALASYDRTIALKPDFAQAHRNRGNALYELGRLDEAVAAWDHTIELAPNDDDAHVNCGTALQRLGRYAEALSCFDRAIALQPQHAQAQYNKALLLLLLGSYESGFELHEQRWHDAAKVGLRKFPQPQWRGESIADKTILLHTEQGLGDTIHMLRYLPLLKAKAARVILELHRTIRPLLGPMADGVIVIKPGSLPPSFDVHCPLMSLPLAFGTRVDTIPAQIPYLTIPAERMPMWRSRLPESLTLRVGLAWSGSPKHRHDRHRSIALDHLAPLLNVAGVSFVSLQRDYRDGDLPTLARLPIERIDGAIRDFGDTAAAIEQCDLVISVDTAVAHLAGSLGKPLWLLLPYVPDWRWLLDRTDSPWYPTARLFRQTGTGDWDSVIATVANQLSAFPRGIRQHREKAAGCRGSS